MNALRISVYALVLLLTTAWNIFAVKLIVYDGIVPMLYAPSVLLQAYLMLLPFIPKATGVLTAVNLLFFTVLELTLFQFSALQSYGESNGDSFFKLIFHDAHIPATMDTSGKPISGWNGNDSEFWFEHRMNSLGLRDDEEIGGVKLLLIGDSFIEGVGIVQENAPDKLLEREIGCSGCVLNIGVAGSDLYNSLRFLKRFHEDGVGANAVILNINQTDITDLVMQASFYGIEEIHPPSTLFQVLFGSSFLARHVIIDLLGYNHLLFNDEQSLAAEQAALAVMKRKIAEYHQYCHANGLAFMVSLQRTDHHMVGDLSAFDSVAHWMEQNSVNHVDLLENVGELQEPIQVLHWAIDGHFNETGYRWFIGCVYDNIQNKYPQFWEEITSSEEVVPYSHAML
jgi:hypothetical protein